MVTSTEEILNGKLHFCAVTPANNVYAIFREDSSVEQRFWTQFVFLESTLKFPKNYFLKIAFSSVNWAIIKTVSITYVLISKRCNCCNFRRFSLQMFFKIGVGFFFGKVTGLQACSFVKKRLQHRYFPVIFKNTFFTEHL